MLPHINGSDQSKEQDLAEKRFADED